LLDYSASRCFKTSVLDATYVPSLPLSGKRARVRVNKNILTGGNNGG